MLNQLPCDNYITTHKLVYARDYAGCTELRSTWYMLYMTQSNLFGVRLLNQHDQEIACHQTERERAGSGYETKLAIEGQVHCLCTHLQQ